MEDIAAVRCPSILVLGDSHVRAFSGSASFLPVFLGPGKENCFLDDQRSENLKCKLSDVLDVVHRANILLVLGEPDSRFYLGYGWYPWKVMREGEGVKVSATMRRGIEASARRYCELLDLIAHRETNTYAVLSVIPTERKIQNHLAGMFNDILRHACKQRNICFVDICADLVNHLGELDVTFRLDPVHLNTKIQRLVAARFHECSSLHSSSDAGSVLKICEYEPKHGCYVLRKRRRNAASKVRSGWQSLFKKWRTEM